MRMRANNVLVEPKIWRGLKRGSIYIPAGTQGNQFGHGIIHAVGPGIWTQSGQQLPVEAAVGDHVLYYKQGAVEITVSEKEMCIIQEPGIIALLDHDDFEAPIDVEELTNDVDDNKENPDV